MCPLNPVTDHVRRLFKLIKSNLIFSEIEMVLILPHSLVAIIRELLSLYGKLYYCTYVLNKTMLYTVQLFPMVP